MRVLLAMPRYDSRATFAAVQSLYHCSDPDNPRLEVVNTTAAGSLLTGCFNSIWAAARNEWEAGRADAFAMIHSDVAAEPYWLDILHAEMERVGADLIGVSVPIKDSRWLHSTASETGDHWRVRRLSSEEVHRLPETFTDEDLEAAGYGNLLLNTGLWLCRLGPWCLEALFHVEDRISRGPDGRWRAGTVPEDWNFSRRCRALGLKLACTRKVHAEHFGESKWNNQNVAGWRTDLQNDPALADWLWPRDVRGWLTEDEGRELALSAFGRDVLEIGAYCGRSTVCMAQTARSVTSVDTFDGRATPAHPGRSGDGLGAATWEEFCDSVTRYELLSKVRPLAGESGRVLPDLERDRQRFGLAFIDADHSEAAVLRDAEMASRLLTPGGLLAFHDYRSPCDPGVTAAVDRVLSRGGRLLRLTGTVAVVDPALADFAGPGQGG